MKAIILAAGRGSRMQSMTDERPKCLVEIRGKSLLAWQLQSLRDAGIHGIGIVTGYRHELLAGLGLPLFHNPRWSETNMLASLACASPWLARGPCIVSYSDIFYGKDIVRALSSSAADIAVAYDPEWLELWRRRFGDPLLDAETFRLDAMGGLTEIGGKPASVAEIEGQYMGLLRFTPSGWAAMDARRRDMPAAEADRLHMTGMLQRMIRDGYPISAVANSGPWGEVDSADDLKAYNDK